jgi:cysteinyl-tRNA synthetase
MIALIQRLEEKEMAYLSGGDVYYRVAEFKSYGQLSKRDLSLESAGVRVEVSELKENPLDFVLWKSSKPGEPWWDSPWGKGRPGWHIECSAMAMRLLGETIDIHGGGEDLLFPHHENEIAQSEASTGKKFVNTWIHNGFVTVNQEKMSKSLGNFFTIREVFDSYIQRKYQPEVIGEIIRYFLLSTHYRQPVQFSDQALSEAHSGLNRFYELLSKCRGGSEIESIEERQLDSIIESARKKFEESMDDDFNTPEAIGALHSLRSDINKESRFLVFATLRRKILNHFLLLGEPLGLFTVSPDQWQFRDPNRFDDQVTRSVGALIQERTEAKLKRDFKKADQIRKELSEKGIILEDHSDGTTTWKR